jgi:hypothetical protein
LRQEILSILKAAGEMTVATVRADGYPQATTVSGSAGRAETNTSLAQPR